MNGNLQRYLSKLVTVLAPVLYGFAMAYLLAPIVNWIEGLIRKGLKRLSKGQEPKIRGGLLRGVSILLTWAVVAYLLYLLMSVLIPQLIDSVAMLINNAESYYNKIYVWVTNLLEKNPEIAGWVEKNLESYYNDLMKVLTEQVLPGCPADAHHHHRPHLDRHLGSCDLHHQLPGGPHHLRVPAGP